MFAAAKMTPAAQNLFATLGGGPDLQMAPVSLDDVGGPPYALHSISACIQMDRSVRKWRMSAEKVSGAGHTSLTDV